MPTALHRRLFLSKLLAVPAVIWLAGCAESSTPVASRAGVAPAPSQPATPSGASAPPAGQPDAAAALAPTLACGGEDELTAAQTEGPYFKPNSPLRVSLIEDGSVGTRLMVSGYVLTKSCQPVAQALLDFWHADSTGEYDNSGFHYRGHQFTSTDGKFTLQTVLPGQYTGRTRHIHVKVQAPNQPVLTTQLYFAGEPRNGQDGIFDEALLMTVQDVAEGKQAAFNIVLNLA